VVYDAEHFFDGYKANPEYAIETLRAAMRGGANWIVLCDTNGGMACPWELEGIVKAVQAQITAPLGIHCHDDTGVAVANSLAAVHAGATQVQGVFNGYGERCGNANLATIAANLRFKMGAELQCAENFPRLRSVCQALDQVANMPEDHRAPYVGSSAFAHKGGAHIDGVMKVARSFEHIDPAAVGNARTFVTSDQAGGALIVGKLEGIAPNMDKKSPEVASLLDLVKQKEALGFAFDSAEASFLVLAKGHLGLFKPPFETISYRVIETGDCSASHISEATVKLRIACEVVHVVSEGDGPVNALDAALRKALAPHYPFLDLVKLGDFKVRVLGTNVGTDARVRVWTEFSDGEEEWNTAGVSTNIIEASWNALLDGINYKIMKHR
jgi:2-isopropylmalate synthase